MFIWLAIHNTVMGIYGVISKYIFSNYFLKPYVTWVILTFLWNKLLLFCVCFSFSWAHAISVLFCYCVKWLFSWWPSNTLYSEPLMAGRSLNELLKNKDQISHWKKIEKILGTISVCVRIVSNLALGYTILAYTMQAYYAWWVCTAVCPYMQLNIYRNVIYLKCSN